jgi:hypothetical protein
LYICFSVTVTEEEQPGFVIYPFDSSFVSKMKERIIKLEEAHKNLIAKASVKNNGGPSASGEPNRASSCVQSPPTPVQGSGEAQPTFASA